MERTDGEERKKTPVVVSPFPGSDKSPVSGLWPAAAQARRLPCFKVVHCWARRQKVSCFR